MQIELIETFLDLIETRSFNRTGDRLGITQSTVSGRVAALESALDVRLFTRSRAGTDLTTEGLRFEPHARTLRHEWHEARRRVQPQGNAAITLRLGIQNDLAAGLIGDWMVEFRARLPDCAFYIEPDYSTQMCLDLLTGALDFAVLFTPKAQPDLHFTTLGDMAYRLISSDTDNAAGLTAARHIVPHFSPAFAREHRAMLPHLALTPVSVGQSLTVSALLDTMGGSGFVMEPTAHDMAATGRFHLVKDVAPMHQPVFAATHLRNRTSRLHRELLRIVQKHFRKP